MTLTLTTPIQYVPRVGPAMSNRMERLGIRTVRDLLYYAPFRYNDFSKITLISHAQVGKLITIHGTVVSIKNIFTKNRKRMCQVRLEDTSGVLSIVWFNQMYLTKVIKPGDMLACSGTIGWFGNSIVMESPEYEIVQPEKISLHTGRLVPVYSETEGVSSKWLRGRIDFVLSEMLPTIVDFLPENIKKTFGLWSLAAALKQIHFPDSLDSAKVARERLAFDELFILQLQSWHKRRIWETTQHSPTLTINNADISAFTDTLPFQLTVDQLRAIATIKKDLEKPIPMNRLLLGDVGSGKTVVSAVAMYIAAKNGFSSVLMAPTQILAEQHFNTISTLLKPFGIPVDLVMSHVKNHPPAGGSKVKIKNTKSKINKPKVLVGTHALLEKPVEFEKIGLVVIDEQQRFGVHQRSRIRDKGTDELTPHLLTMTATPIPRSIALTIYGNLDVSVLSEMPIGRQVVKTWVIPKEKRGNAYDWIKKQLNDFDSRAFIVCPFIEKSESMATVKAVTNEYEILKTSQFKNIPLGLLHGKIKPKEKTQILDDFVKGKTKILVTTPVVEVGIDIPKATIMMIEGADRFGLSQLHQLRGRVGRGDLQSYCLLLTESTGEETIARLKCLETNHSGPKLAEIDLSLRGEGDVMGTRQHGIPSLAFSSLSDIRMIEKTKEAVETITKDDPDLLKEPLLREIVQSSTIKNVNLD